MEDVVLLRDELTIGFSRCASLENVLVAWESVHAISGRQAIIIGTTIKLQDGTQEGTDRPHVAKPVEHMEREAPLAVGHVEHESPSLIGANRPRPSVLTYHRDLLRL